MIIIVLFVVTGFFLFYSKDKSKSLVQVSDVVYEGSDFKKSCFSVGKDIIYLCVFNSDESEYYIAKMPINGNNMEKVPYDIPADMKVLGMDVDLSGECSILLSTFHEEELEGDMATFIDFKTTRIDRIRENGELNYSIDISNEFQNAEEIPLIFESDANGNYYISKDNILVQLSIDNTIEEYEIDGYYEAVNCEGDNVYAVYWDNSTEKTILSSIDKGEFCSITELENLDDDYREISVYGKELYMYSRNGLYKLNNNKQRIIYNSDQIDEIRPFIISEDLSPSGELCMLLKIDDKYLIRHVKYGNNIS